MKKDKLLAVLDMTEDEQRAWVCGNNLLQKHRTICNDDLIYDWEHRTESLADLAFRLRDEADNVNYERAIHLVEFYERGKKRGWWNKDSLAYWFKYEDALRTTIEEWLIHETKPIHWIIANLIAKDAKDGK